VALARVLGDEEIRAAVDLYVRGCEGNGLVCHVLRLLKPKAAREECVRLARSDCELSLRRSAVELLRVVADADALIYVREFLADPDPEIQSWAAGIVDYVVLDHVCDDPNVLAPYLELMRVHANPLVVEVVELVEEMLDARASDDSAS
jgi:HEAT repeat protein